MASGTDFVSMLMDMGFSKEKAERGLSMTGHKGVEAAMEWIFNHSEEFDSGPSGSSAEQSSNSDPASTENPPAEAKSIKCDDCGKLFSTQGEVEFHANKSGHSNFSESTDEKKPLTEEERRERMRQIDERRKILRIEREEKEKTEAILKEKARIQSGKDMTEARRKMEELEMKKIIELRKREKEEERQARQRVKDLIEADKMARKGLKPEEPKPVAPVQQPVLNIAPKDYTHTKIQVRLTNGSTLTESFSIKEQLAAVRLFVELNRQDTDGGPFSLMTTFPRKVYQEDELGKTLEDLQLVPSAVLIVTKSKS